MQEKEKFYCIQLMTFYICIVDVVILRAYPLKRGALAITSIVSSDIKDRKYNSVYIAKHHIKYMACLHLCHKHHDTFMLNYIKVKYYMYIDFDPDCKG